MVDSVDKSVSHTRLAITDDIACYKQVNIKYGILW